MSSSLHMIFDRRRRPRASWNLFAACASGHIGRWPGPCLNAGAADVASRHGESSRATGLPDIPATGVAASTHHSKQSQPRTVARPAGPPPLHRPSTPHDVALQGPLRASPRGGRIRRTRIRRVTGISRKMLGDLGIAHEPLDIEHGRAPQRTLASRLHRWRDAEIRVEILNGSQAHPRWRHGVSGERRIFTTLNYSGAPSHGAPLLTDHASISSAPHPPRRSHRVL